MPDLAIYREKAAEYGGIIVLWIDQSADHRIRSGNISGVCFGLAKAYVLAYQAGGISASEFINSFQGQGFNDLADRIPPKYIKLQIKYQVSKIVYGQILKGIAAELKEADRKRERELAEKLRSLEKAKEKDFYGAHDRVYNLPELKGLNKIRYAEFMFEVMKSMLEKHPSQYFLINMMGGKDSGHSIAFGFRPDIVVGGVRGFYQFFDANFGIFTFRTIENLKEFFDMEIWLSEYASDQYSKIQVVSFNVKN